MNDNFNRFAFSISTLYQPPVLMLKQLFSAILLLYTAIACGQNGLPEIYRGGNDDGYRSVNALNQNNTPGMYKGGADDGYGGSTALLQNAIPNIYKGGNNDGHDMKTALLQNTVPNIYKGGNNDGHDMKTTLLQNTVPNIYKGGNNDGYDIKTAALQNTLPNIYLGGNNDGYHLNSVAGQNLTPGIYLGGVNDGYASAITVKGLYIFTGAGNWSIASNWLNGLVPPLLLPAGYEIQINGTGNCILDVQQTLAPGSRLTVLTGKLLQVPAIQ